MILKSLKVPDISSTQDGVSSSLVLILVGDAVGAKVGLFVGRRVGAAVGGGRHRFTLAWKSNPSGQMHSRPDSDGTNVFSHLQRASV